MYIRINDSELEEADYPKANFKGKSAFALNSIPNGKIVQSFKSLDNKFFRKIGVPLQNKNAVGVIVEPWRIPGKLILSAIGSVSSGLMDIQDVIGVEMPAYRPSKISKRTQKNIRMIHHFKSIDTYKLISSFDCQIIEIRGSKVIACVISEDERDAQSIRVFKRGELERAINVREGEVFKVEKYSKLNTVKYIFSPGDKNKFLKSEQKRNFFEHLRNSEIFTGSGSKQF